MLLTGALEASPTANAYAIAGIALAGVLLGSITSAVSQAIAAARQRTFTSQQTLRDDRRVTYANLLSELETTQQLIGRFRTYKGSAPIPVGTDVQLAMMKLWRAEAQTKLIAGAAVEGLVFKVVDHTAADAVAAMSGDPEPERLPAGGGARAMRLAMQAELGIKVRD